MRAVAGAGLLLLFTWTHLAADAAIISPFSCVSNHYQADRTAWLSVVRGPGFHVGNVYQYWLTQAYVYGLDAQSDWLDTQAWKLPPDAHPVNGLTLAYHDYAPDDQELRVLLLNSSNCLLEYYVTSVLPNEPSGYRLNATYCFGGGLPLWQKMVPGSGNQEDMTNIKWIYLVSLTHIAVVSADSIQPVSIIKLPAGGEIPVTTTVVGAVYRRNSAPGAQDQLFIIRGSYSTNKTSQASELIYYRVDVNNHPGPRLAFDHVTYLQGASDTLFLNGNIMELFWTQVVEENREGPGNAQGLLYGYGLEAPHRFRQGSLAFSSEARWGAHSFSFKSAYEAMMITTGNRWAEAGYTIYAMSLDSDLPLQLDDSLWVDDSTLPSLGHGTFYPENPLYQDIDYSVVMGSHDTNGNACLRVFFHCPHDASDPRCRIG